MVARPATPTHRFTPLEITSALSVLLNLPPNTPGLAEFAGQLEEAVNRRPEFQASGLGGDALRAMAMTSLPPQLSAMMDPARRAELERQNAAAVNVTSAEAAILAQRAGLLQGSQRGDAIAIGSIQTEKEYREAAATAALVGAGISFDTFRALRAEGFGVQQMLAAAGLTKTLGINTDRNAVSVAVLQRELPGVDKELIASRDHWRGVGDLERRAAEAERRGDTAQAAELRKRAQEARERAERHDREHRERVQRTHPHLVPRLEGVQGDIKRTHTHLNAAVPGATPAQARELRRAFEAAQLNPNDPEAQRRYAEIKAKFGDKPESSRRFAQAEETRKTVAAAKKEKDVVKEQVQAETVETRIATAAARAENDDGLAALNGGPATPQRPSPTRAAAAPGPNQPTV